MGLWRSNRAGGRFRRHTAAVLILLAACVLMYGCAIQGASGTPTSAPTVSPSAVTANPLTPTPTALEARLDAVVRQAIGSGTEQIRTTYDGTTRAADVAITLGGQVPAEADLSATQERVKTLCFQAQRALWTGGTAPLSQVNVSVVGAIIDQYADITTQAYGSVLLKAATAARFSWSAMTADGAWGAYDDVYLRPGYNDAS